MNINEAAGRSKLLSDRVDKLTNPKTIFRFFFFFYDNLMQVLLLSSLKQSTFVVMK